MYLLRSCRIPGNQKLPLARILILQYTITGCLAEVIYCKPHVTRYGLHLNKWLASCHNQGSPVIDGIFLVQKMCIYSSVMIITTVLITRSAVQWHGQLVMHHVYIIELDRA